MEHISFSRSIRNGRSTAMFCVSHVWQSLLPISPIPIVPLRFGDGLYVWMKIAIFVLSMQPLRSTTIEMLPLKRQGGQRSESYSWSSLSVCLFFPQKTNNNHEALSKWLCQPECFPSSEKERLLGRGERIFTDFYAQAVVH